MYNDNYKFTADLLAFVEWQDLPPSLYPFAKCASMKDDVKLERDARLVILRIREAPDACHAIIVNDGTTMEEIEDSIQRDLEVVKLSEEAQEILGELLETTHRGEFAYFMNQELSRV